jgi:hypothetical protein
MALAAGSPPLNIAHPREVRRGGGAARVYRHPAERLAMNLGGALIFAGISVWLAGELGAAQLEHNVALDGVLLAYLLVPLAWFGWSFQIGVRVTAEGVRNVSTRQSSFTAWEDITRFVVDYYTPLSTCVLAEHPDGSRTPLDAIARWAVWRDVLDPYCDALNSELEFARSRRAARA